MHRQKPTGADAFLSLACYTRFFFLFSFIFFLIRTSKLALPGLGELLTKDPEVWGWGHLNFSKICPPPFPDKLQPAARPQALSVPHLGLCCGDAQVRAGAGVGSTPLLPCRRHGRLPAALRLGEEGEPFLAEGGDAGREIVGTGLRSGISLRRDDKEKKKRAGGAMSLDPSEGDLLRWVSRKCDAPSGEGTPQDLPATQARILPGAVSGSSRGELGAAARRTGAECCGEEPSLPCPACAAPEVERSPTSGRPSTGSLPLSHHQVIWGAASAWWGAEQLLGQGSKAVSCSPLRCSGLPLMAKLE